MTPRRPPRFVTPASILLLTLLLLAQAASARGSVAAGGQFSPQHHSSASWNRAAPPPPAGLRLDASPTLVDVGDFETFTVTATAWPAPASVTLSFLSGHHGFTGGMIWDVKCGCFRVAVDLARRIHPIEQARATATVRYGSRVIAAATTFFSIRGLAPNGRDYAPGGTPGLTGWVSESDPIVNTQEHFCAWVTTQDGLGVAGFRVGFVVHYSYGTRQWNPGNTGSTGLLCSYRSIGKSRSGFRVYVDIYANGLHQRTSFVPRTS